ncbi:MAG: helix-turn-helix domain-containing protein [Thermomicrobiales bacterium]
MSSLVSSLTFDSDRVPSTTRLNDWRELMSATHDVSVPEPEAAPFHVEMKLWNLGQLIISSGRFSPQAFNRTPDHVRGDHIDHYLLFIQGEGQRILQTAGRELLLTPGDIVLMEMGRPCWSIATEGTSNSLYLPRELLRNALPTFDYPHGMVLRNGLSKLLANNVQSMATYLPDIPSGSISSVVDATKNLAFACLAASQNQSTPTPPLETAIRRQIERYIDTNLGDPALSASSICQAFGVSRSTLYRIFDFHAGVANFIKRRRLQHVRLVLMAAHDARTLAEIAEDFGFTSSAHFSRSFREAFGYSPSDLRLQRNVPFSRNDESDPLHLASMFR